MSIGIGESFRLSLIDSTGEEVDVNWQASEPGYVEIDGNWITGLDYINDSDFTVFITVGEVTYSCIVRVQ